MPVSLRSMGTVLSSYQRLGMWRGRNVTALSTGVPDGHGHTYTREFVDGWATVLRTPGWTPDKAEQLQDIITTDE